MQGPPATTAPVSSRSCSSHSSFGSGVSGGGSRPNSPSPAILGEGGRLSSVTLDGLLVDQTGLLVDFMCFCEVCVMVALTGSDKCFWY